MKIRSLLLLFLFSYNMQLVSHAYSNNYDDDARSSIFSALSGVARVSVAFTALKYAYENTDNAVLKRLILPIIGGMWFVGEVNKENPKYYNHVATLTKSPWVVTRRKLEKVLCGGESLTWNQVVLLKMRLDKMFAPFVKQSTVVDLSRSKRLSKLEADTQEPKDMQWEQIAESIITQLDFFCSQLEMHKQYYKASYLSKKRNFVSHVALMPLDVLKACGATCMRISTTNNHEIALYIEQIQTMMRNIVEYIKIVPALDDLDKEKLKTYKTVLLDSLEHLASLVDVSTAAAQYTPEGKLSLNGSVVKSAKSRYGYSGDTD